MHKANRMWWEYCKDRYAKYLQNDVDVLEIGSHYVNGTVRDYFSGNGDYIGVDWREGKNVDVVCFAHDMNFDKKFDVVISCSTLEHDRYWKASLDKMLEYLKEDGILLLSWGTENCVEHCRDHADDNGYHPKPAGLVIDHLEKAGIYIHEFNYEGVKFPGVTIKKWGGGMGEVALVGFWDKKHAIGEKHLDKLLPEDAK